MAISASYRDESDDLKVLAQLLQVIIRELKHRDLRGAALAIENIAVLGKHRHLGDEPLDQLLEALHRVVCEDFGANAGPQILHLVAILLACASHLQLLLVALRTRCLHQCVQERPAHYEVTLADSDDLLGDLDCEDLDLDGELAQYLPLLLVHTFVAESILLERLTSEAGHDHLVKDLMQDMRADAAENADVAL